MGLWRNKRKPEPPGRKTLAPLSAAPGMCPFPELTWTCHVCGLERPDAKISVFTRVIRFENGVTMRENFMYCNDKPDCIQNVSSLYFISGREEDSVLMEVRRG